MEVLFVPWILCLLLAVVVCLIKRWMKTAILLFAIMLAANAYWQVFSFSFSPLNRTKRVGDVRVLTWNVSCSDSTATRDIEGLARIILRQNADVVFITEYLRTERPQLDSILCSHYAYKGALENCNTQSDFYSRIPIDTCAQIGNGADGVLLRYDLRLDEGSLRLYCVHLWSNNLVDGDTFYPDSIQDKEGVMHYLKNYEAASQIREQQMQLIVSDFEEIPTIVMGDMNDVVGSPCMKVLERAKMRDAWWDGGFGYGATFHDPVPYRIDHILYGSGEGKEGLEVLELKGIKKVSRKGVSDHDALVTDFEVKR